VTQFQEHTGDLLAQALDKLYKDNKAPLKGWCWICAMTRAAC
jgi:carboxyl-terminal processing protease